MTGFEQAAAYLPAALKNKMDKLPETLKGRVQEIRLRLDAPLILSAPDGEWMITQEGAATRLQCRNLLICPRNQLEDCFLNLCEYSIHTHQQELRNGFITAPNGCRAGIAGTAVLENGAITSIRSITSICLRIARHHDGCANRLVSAISSKSGIHSLLICGEPSSGKSSLLKDLARQLSDGKAGRRYRVSVVDERGELSGENTLPNCDVLRCPKAEGIQQAVRCLAPDVVIFDELGTMREVSAVLEGLNSGVAAISTAHCRDRKSFVRRSQLLAAVNSGAFEKIAFLKGRQFPGEIDEISEMEDCMNEYDENCRFDSDCSYRNMRGTICVGRTESASRVY